MSLLGRAIWIGIVSLALTVSMSYCAVKNSADKDGGCSATFRSLCPRELDDSAAGYRAGKIIFGPGYASVNTPCVICSLRAYNNMDVKHPPTYYKGCIKAAEEAGFDSKTGWKR